MAYSPCGPWVILCDLGGRGRCAFLKHLAYARPAPAGSGVIHQDLHA